MTRAVVDDETDLLLIVSSDDHQRSRRSQRPRRGAVPRGPDRRRHARVRRPLGHRQDHGRRHRPQPPASPGPRSTGPSPAARTWRFEALARAARPAASSTSVDGPARRADTLEDALVVGIVEAARFLAGHEAAPATCSPTSPSGCCPPSPSTGLDGALRHRHRVHRPAPRAASSPTTRPRPPAPSGSSASFLSYALDPRPTARPHRRGRRPPVRPHLRPPRAHRRTDHPPGALTMSTNEELIGRDDINDLEAILGDHQHRRRRGHPRGEGQRRGDLHVGLREGRSARRSTGSTRRPRPRSGTARPTCRGTPRSTRRRSSPTTRWPAAASTPAST